MGGAWAEEGFWDAAYLPCLDGWLRRGMDLGIMH